MTEDASTNPTPIRRTPDDRSVRIANRVADIVAYHTSELIGEVTSMDIRSKSRKREVVMARHMLAFVLRRHSRMSYPEIGAHCNRDHSTIMHAERMAVADIETNPFLSKLYSLVCEQMGWTPLKWLRAAAHPSSTTPEYRHRIYNARQYKPKYPDAVDKDDAAMGLSSRPEDYVTPR